MSRSEWIAYRNPRVASHAQYQMIDTPIFEPADRGLWQGGLRFADGRMKPGVYAAYRLPLFVRLLGPSRVEVWGAARPGGRGAAVQIQSRTGKGAYSNLALAHGQERARLLHHPDQGLRAPPSASSACPAQDMRVGPRRL